MKIARYAIIAFFLGLRAMGFCTDGATIAVLDFENNSFFDSETFQPLTKGLAEMMNTEIDRIEAVQVVERRRLQAMLDEISLGQSGLVSEKNTVEVGKMLGAQHLVFGGFMVMMDQKMRIDVRIVEVETGLTLKAGEATGKSKDVLSLIKRVSKRVLKDLNVGLSKKEQRALDKADKLDVEAVVAFSQGLESEEKGMMDEAIAHFQKAIEIESGFEQARERLTALTKDE